MEVPALFVLLTVAVLVPGARGFSSGAPDYTCNTMRPNHPLEALEDPPPFSLRVLSDTYRANVPLQVQIVAAAGRTFKGFTIQARPAGNPDVSVRIGSFVPNDRTKLVCGTGALTHNTKLSVNTLTIDWSTLSELQGDIIFRATVVESLELWYAEIYSKVITVGAPTTSITTNTTTSTTTTPSTTTTTTSLPPTTTISTTSMQTTTPVQTTRLSTAQPKTTTVAPTTTPKIVTTPPTTTTTTTTSRPVITTISTPERTPFQTKSTSSSAATTTTTTTTASSVSAQDPVTSSRMTSRPIFATTASRGEVDQGTGDNVGGTGNESDILITNTNRNEDGANGANCVVNTGHLLVLVIAFLACVLSVNL